MTQRELPTLSMAGYQSWEVEFDCGHVLTRALLLDVIDHAPDVATAKYWRDQSYPYAIGSVASCPRCRGKRGQPRTVVRLQAIEIKVKVKRGRKR